MKRLLMGPLVVFLLCTSAAPARADMAEVLDNLFGLSGPGGFFGIRFSEDLICWSVARRATEKIEAEEDREKIEPRPGGVFNCFGTDKRRPLTTIAAAFEWAHTDTNPYTYTTDLAAKDPAVDAR